MSLKEYKRKRNFGKTAEPEGKVERTSGQRFVIQKHAASHLHYDFRLEMEGTLKSWAVPKGVPYQKGEKRLAMHVEDHPVSYIDFEGTIPKGQYGGGTVMVWDFGTFEPLSKTPGKDLAAGKLHFRLKGKKLNGDWHLVRMREGNEWLLIKSSEDAKRISLKMDDTSALSGKPMSEIARGKDVWHSNRPEKSASRPVRAAAPKKEKKQPSAGLRFFEPMKALLVETTPRGDWIYEIKFDGFRALAVKDGDEVRLWSRNEKDFGERFPEIAEALSKVKAESAIIDGEIVALDAEGRSSFQLLQAYDLGQEKPPLCFYAFDLLYLNGEDLKGEALTERKAKLEKLVKKAPSMVRYSASLEGEEKELLAHARKLKLEGLIGKKTSSVYQAGRRSGDWIKLKIVNEQEMVIGGFTNPSGSRQHFGALLVGYFERGKFVFAGKVGTGFNDALLKSLSAKMAKFEANSCPFVNLPEKRPGRYGAGVTASEMKRCHWLKPALVCQIKFSEWTRDGKLRHPVFLGLRDDKDSREVGREQ